MILTQKKNAFVKTGTSNLLTENVISNQVIRI